MLLKCNTCGLDKEEEHFHKDNRAKNKHYGICKECRKKGKVKSTNAKKLDFYIKQSIIRSIHKNKSNFIWERVLGFNLLDLKTHLEYNFKVGMNWDNYGKTWGIALIIPKTYYRYNGINSEFKKCWSLKNMYPLELEKCIKRKLEPELIKKYNLYDILPLGLLNKDLF